MTLMRIFAISLISALPLYTVRLSLFGLPTTVLELSFILFFLIWLIEVLRFGRLVEFFSAIPLKKQLGLFLLITFLSVFISLDPVGGLGIYRAYFLEPVLLFIIFTDLARRKTIFVTDVLLGFAVSAFYLSILAIFQYAFRIDWFAPHEIAAGRVSGLFNSANALSMYLELIVFSLGVVVFRDFKVSKRSIFFAVTLILSIVAIAFSRSNGGLLALFGLIIAIILRYIFTAYGFAKRYVGVHSRLFIPFAACLFSVTIIFIFFSYVKIGTLPQGPYHGSNTFLIRMIVWTGTYNLLSEHWITGAGLDGFKELYATHYLPTQYDEHLQYPHNIFLNFWSEIGLVGLLCFIWICFSLLQKADQTRSPVRIIAYGVIFLIFVHGLVDVPYFKNDLSMEFWVFASLLFFNKRDELNGSIVS
ncbi:MAG: O-antigen ligase family protein [bacterium]|nr:O-antigen ligase family protein [bacterium]